MLWETDLGLLGWFVEVVGVVVVVWRKCLGLFGGFVETVWRKWLGWFVEVFWRK